MNNTVAPVVHPAAIDAYIRHGWQLVPIPSGSKGPSHPEWNRPDRMFRLDMTLPSGYGIGLAHAYSGTMALDVDDWDKAAGYLALRGIDLAALQGAPDAVTIDSGRVGHGKLLYAMPFPMTSKKVTERGVTLLEFRCGTAGGLTVQDVLPPSIHPGTDRPYQWGGRGHWTRLPLIPDALAVLWASLVTAEPAASPQVHRDPNESLDTLRNALSYVDPGCSREEWITAGMALHWSGSISGQQADLDAALAIWDDWSKGSAEKYPGSAALLVQWRSFRTDKTNSVRVGSLLRLATKGGWRPVVDASAMFTAATPMPPRYVDDLLRVPGPDMDMTLWPDVLATRALEVADHVGCDPLVPLWAGLGALCAVADARMRLELVPGFRVPPVLWLMTVGAPADKKTPGARPMLAPLAAIERDALPAFKEALLAWEAKEAAHIAAKKAYLQAASSPEFLLNGDLPGVPDLPPQPQPLRLTVSDITSQKMVRHAAERPMGFLCHLDEMNAWVRKLTDKTSGEDRSAWVRAYEADAYEMDRVGAGTIRAENLAVSIFGNIQPRVLSESVHALSGDGLIQRFLPALLRPEFTRRGDPTMERTPAALAWEQCLRVVHAMPAITYRLDAAAYECFRAYQSEYEAAKRDERLATSHGPYIEAYGKLEGQTGRLILVHHLLSAPFDVVVPLATVERVIRLVRSYLIPALHLSLTDGTDTGALEHWCKEYVVQSATEIEGFTLSQIRHSARRQVDHMTTWQAETRIMDALEVLERAHWIARVPCERVSYRGTTVRWVINPSIATSFADYRAAVVRAKQRRLDSVYSLGYASGKAGQKKVRGYRTLTGENDSDQSGHG